MTIAEFASALDRHPERYLNFILPDGSSVAAHCHVTEIGLVTKRFVDCGGTVRSSESCVLQLWKGTDRHHRLSASKLAGILKIGAQILPRDDLPVEVEYETSVVSQYPLSAVDPLDGNLRLTLGSKHTDCLAREKCGEGDTGCCGDTGGCS